MSVFRALLPAVVLAVLLLASVAVLDHKARPEYGAITEVAAKPAVWPDTLQHFRDPSPDQPWQPFTFPVRVCQVRCTTPYTAWRVQFDWQAEALPDPAVFIPFADANIALYLNGTLIAREGEMQSPPSVYRYYPRLVRLPVGLLKTGRNELSWLLTIERRGIGGVKGLYVANYDPLAKSYSYQEILARVVPQLSLWLQIVCFCFALAMYARGTRESFLGWFVMLAPMWIFNTSWQLKPDWIADPTLRLMAFQLTLFGLLAFSYVFVRSILKPVGRRAVQWALGYFLVGFLIVLIAAVWPGLDSYWRYSLPHFAIKYTALVLLPLTVWQLGRFLLKERDSVLARWVFATAMLPAIAGLHDAIRGSLEPMSYSLSAVAGLGISIAFCLELGRRVLNNHARMANYSQELADTVKAREAELAANFERVRAADRELALSEERHRIMQDMHDGVAGQFSALVHLVNDPNTNRAEIIEHVRVGLADMRLVLDSLAQVDGDLIEAVGALRARVTPMLRAAGMELNWQIKPDLEIRGLSPEAMLHVLRILQEAIHNSIKHAAAKHLSVTAIANENYYEFAVADDGRGLPAAGASPGRYGLSGMQQRAQKLGAALQIESAPGHGAKVRLQLPISSRAANDAPAERWSPAISASR
ncbi:hypothetical protein C7S18_03565 [Ahniella affigens]|uniref:Histidine kinase domain-containing protein n=1 Tax=Ahniella affigens TaxID=2021234 RepID=A0A2P1PNB0_9GAMM|nr:sensor histidine kinase [Ahniella affigens]AVP96322.1 hypothetical protein C7S18_03565 [Ahniella affigens]